MATAEDLKKQRKKLEKLASLKTELAGLNLSKQAAEADKLRKEINKVTEALIKMGMESARVDEFYKAFVKATGSINDVSLSISRDLLKSINELNKAVKEGAEQFLTPFENLKTGASNVTEMLQSAIKVTSDLETISSASRRKNTKEFADASVSLTDKVVKAYHQMIQNEGNLGTAKFKNLNVEKEIADVLLQINALDEQRMQLGKGYYAELRNHANELLNSLENIKTITEKQQENNGLAATAIEKQRELNEEKKKQLEYEAELEKFNERRAIADEAFLRKRRQQDLNDILGPIQVKENLEKKALEDRERELEAFNKRREKEDEARIRKERQLMYNELFKPTLDQIAEEERLRKEAIKAEEKERKDMLKAYDNFMQGMISKLPGGSILSLLGKMGPLSQLLALGIGIGLKLIEKWDVAVSNLTSKLSVSRKQAEQTLRASAGLARQLNFANIYTTQIAEGLTKAQEGLSGMDLSARFLAGNVFTQRLITGATVLSDTFGLAAEEIGGLTDASTAMGISLSSNTAIITTMSKGIFSVNSLMKSIAGLSPKILTGFKGTNAELVGMVSKMKLLGVETNNIVSSNDKLLDIESAITNAFEAQVATGVNIDIDRLMYLQMMGKYNQVFDEQLRTLQKADYLNKPALFQEMIAQGLGLDRESASKMMLRKVLADKVGLTDDVLMQKQKEGVMVLDEVIKAEKLGKITKLEADLLRDVVKEYDSKTIQEKLIRALEDLTLAISSTLAPLINNIRSTIDSAGSRVRNFDAETMNMSETGQNISSGLMTALMVGGGLLLGRKAYKAYKLFKNAPKVAKAGMQAEKVVASYGMDMAAGARGFSNMSSTAGAATTFATYTPNVVAEAAENTGRFSKMLAKAKSGLGLGKDVAKGAGTGAKMLSKGAKVLPIVGSLIGGGIDYAINRAEGRPVKESLIRAGITTGTSAVLGAVGTYFGGAWGGVAGALAGDYLGGEIGDAIYRDEDMERKQHQRDLQQSEEYYNSVIKRSSQNLDVQFVKPPAQTEAQGLSAIMNTVSSKLDTTNSLLNSIYGKPTDITVELDGEKIGKATMDYSSAAMDRGRNLGNNYGYNMGQFTTRLPSRGLVTDAG